MKIYQIKNAFTLVELIVVIVILSILSTIAFLSFNSYSSSARDSTRLSDMSNIAKGLTVQYSIGGKYLMPDNNINLYSGSIAIGYQGKAGNITINTIKLSNNGGKDPLDNMYYTYNINLTQNKYQITGYLESKGNVINRVGYENNLNLINQTYSTNYTNRYPYTKGDGIGVILSSTGGTGSIIYTPLEDSGTGIDVSSGTQVSGKILISNNVDSSVGVSVGSMSGYVSIIKPDGTIGKPGLNCNDLKNNGNIVSNGIYYIKPDSNSAFQVYCDMSSDGGGWTLVGTIAKTQTPISLYSSVSSGFALTPSDPSITGIFKYDISSFHEAKEQVSCSYSSGCQTVWGSNKTSTEIDQIRQSFIAYSTRLSLWPNFSNAPSCRTTYIGTDNITGCSSNTGINTDTVAGWQINANVTYGWAIRGSCCLTYKGSGLGYGGGDPDGTRWALLWLR